MGCANLVKQHTNVPSCYPGLFVKYNPLTWRRKSEFPALLSGVIPSKKRSKFPNGSPPRDLRRHSFRDHHKPKAYKTSPVKLVKQIDLWFIIRLCEMISCWNDFSKRGMKMLNRKIQKLEKKTTKWKDYRWERPSRWVSLSFGAEVGKTQKVEVKALIKKKKKAGHLTSRSIMSRESYIYVLFTSFTRLWWSLLMTSSISFNLRPIKGLLGPSKWPIWSRPK